MKLSGLDEEVRQDAARGKKLGDSEDGELTRPPVKELRGLLDGVDAGERPEEFTGNFASCGWIPAK